ncbi:hypothetical protein J7L06_09890 [Candidatus Bathyarchaeota archaeon]|nr:hypothetical protein [Candidatus Bathyarchaeota archaeon]
MTKYLWMNLKVTLKNPHLIFWAILFIEFWVFMWAYVFGSWLPSDASVIQGYTAAAYSNLLTISISSVAMALVNSILYASRSLRFVTKYTSLSSARFLIENLVSSVFTLLIVSGILFLSTGLVFSSRFGFPIPVDNPVGLAFVTLLGTILIYVLSVTLGLLIIALRAFRFANFLSSLPLIFAFVTYSALWIDFNSAIYLSPFNVLASLMYYYFCSEIPPTGNYFMAGHRTFVNLNLAWLSLLTYILVLTAVSMALLRKVKGVSIEEIRLT